MNFKSLSDRCNMTYEKFIKRSMSMVERRINYIIAKNQQLINALDRNKNHPWIRKYSHKAFNTI